MIIINIVLHVTKSIILMKEEEEDYQYVIILTVCKPQIHVNDQDYPAGSGWW